MKIDKFLNQKVSYEKRTGNDDFAEYTYASPKILKARIEHNTQIVERSDNSYMRAEFTIFLNQEVFVGDRIDGREVLIVRDYVWRDGTIQGYEVTT